MSVPCLCVSMCVCFRVCARVRVCECMTVCLSGPSNVFVPDNCARKLPSTRNTELSSTGGAIPIFRVYSTQSCYMGFRFAHVVQYNNAHA